MTSPSESLPPKAKRRAALPVTPWTRGANWIVGLSAAALMAASVGGFIYDLRQLEQIAAQHLRLMVAGPAELQAGAAARYIVSTTAIKGDPLSSLIDLSLHSPDGKGRLGHHDKTDESGRLEVLIPADMALGSQAELRVAATHAGQREEMKAALRVVPGRYAAHLTLDKPQYQPGETVFYRVLALTRYGLEAERALPIQFEIRRADGTTVANSTLAGITERGVGNGSFAIPELLPGGRYTLLVRSLDGAFAEQKRIFLVGPGAPPPKQSPQESPKQSGQSKRDRTAKPGKIEVKFFPEGGQLAEGLENRVYFTARNSAGQPLQLKGTLVDGQDIEIAEVETVREGRGSFSFVPHGDESYRLRISSPAGDGQQPQLPAVATEQRIALSAGIGVFSAGAPLEFNIRASQPNIPLVVTAWCRGAPVGEQTLVTTPGGGYQGSKTVVIPLDEQVGGVIRLIVYDYSRSPPRPLAQRLVYRQMARRLTVRAAEPPPLYRPGDKVNLTLVVSDEKGQPAPATLGISVLDDALLKQSQDHAASMTAHFLLGTGIEQPEDLDHADFYLSDDKDAPVALDLLLGTRAQRPADAAAEPHKGDGDEPGQPARQIGPPSEVGPPLVFDNLSELQAKYEHSLSDYQQRRTQALYALTVLSFFGALGLLLLVTMLGLLKIVTGLRLWLPSVVAAACCLLIGMVLMNPSRHKISRIDAVPFASFAPLPPAQQAAGKPPAEGPEKRPQQYPFTAGDYAHKHLAETPQVKRDLAQALYWNPIKIAGADGRVQISFDLPDSASTFHVLVDAHGDGRIGCGRLDIVSRPAKGKAKK